MAKAKPELVPGKVVVTALANDWYSGINGMIERARQISDGNIQPQIIGQIDHYHR